MIQSKGEKKKGGCGGNMRLRRISQLVWNCALCTTKHVRLLLGEDGFKDPRTDPRDPHPEELQLNYEQFPKTIVQLQKQYN